MSMINLIAKAMADNPPDLVYKYDETGECIGYTMGFDKTARAVLDCLQYPTKGMKSDMAEVTGSQDIAHECFLVGIRSALKGK